jgi:ATP-dependent Zn protease
VQTLIKVNSGEMFMNKYYAYSAAFTDRVTDINEGDLVLVENISTKNNDVFAYSTPDGITYAVQTFSGEPERTSGKNSVSDSITVLNTSIKGKVTRIYPSIGKVASAISENFMTVITGLLVLAVVIILLLIFAFRRASSKSKTAKDNFSFDEDEDFNEASDEDFSLT